MIDYEQQAAICGKAFERIERAIYGLSEDIKCIHNRIDAAISAQANGKAADATAIERVAAIDKRLSNIEQVVQQVTVRFFVAVLTGGGLGAVIATFVGKAVQ